MNPLLLLLCLSEYIIYPNKAPVETNFVVIVQWLSRVRLFATHGLQHSRLPCPSPSPGVYSNSCTLSWWCHPTISSPFSFCLQYFPASGSFSMNWLNASGGQNIEASASTSVLSVNIQDWFPLGLTGLISLQSKGFSRVFSSTTVQKDHFFGAQPSLWSNSQHPCMTTEKPIVSLINEIFV